MLKVMFAFTVSPQERMDEARAKRTKVPAEVEEISQRIARLHDRMKAGDEDLSADDLQAIIQKAEAKRAELMSAVPEVKGCWPHCQRLRTSTENRSPSA